MANRRLPTSLLLVIPLVLAVGAYARVLGGGRVFDDVQVVQENPALADLPGVLRGWSGGLLHGGRPTTEVALALTQVLGGPSPRSFHLTSLLLHLATVVLVFLFTRAVLRLAGRGPGSLPAVVVAGLFALHPMQSEAVSYVSQCSEVLASGLYVATLLVLLRADRTGPGLRGALLGAAALVLSTLGMGAKAIVATAPLSWLLLVAVVPRRGPAEGSARWRWRIALVVPLVLVDLLVVRGALVSVVGRPDAGFSVPRSAPGNYFLTQWRAVVTYLRLLIWPTGQNADWSFPMSSRLAEPDVLAAGALLTLLVAGAAVLGWRCRRGDGPGAASGRAAAYGVAWFFLLLAPTSSFLPVADVMVEHRVYLASWGVFLGVVLGGEALLAHVPAGRRTLAAVLCVGAAWVALATTLHRRNAVWESDLALWTDAVSKSPGKARPRLGLGVALAQRGDQAGAADQFTAGLKRAPADAIGLRTSLHHNLGIALVMLGRSEEALEHLRQAVGLDPTTTTPAQTLALALWETGDAAGAEREARAVLDRAPDSPTAARVMGQARMAAGDDAGALPFIEQAVRARPSDGAVRYDLGAVYANLGRIAEACNSWRVVLRLPSVGGAHEAARQGLSILACPPQGLR